MNILDRSFPHPVLSPFRDDVLPNQFVLKLKIQPDADTFYINHEFVHDNPTIHGLTASGQAHYALHVECKRNYFRQIFPLKSGRGVVPISASELVGHVEMVGLVVSAGAISDYAPVGMHEDYEGRGFLLGVGDVLAASQTQSFEAYTDYDPLARISSIMTIRKSVDLDEGPMVVDLQDDKIVVTLSQADFTRYTDLKADPSLGPLLANQVVVPALLEALHEMRSLSDDEFEMDMQKRWFRSMHKKIADIGIDIRADDKPVMEVLQLLLKLPLRRSLDGLIRVNPLDSEK
jgi:hypothetical protein